MSVSKSPPEDKLPDPFLRPGMIKVDLHREDFRDLLQ